MHVLKRLYPYLKLQKKFIVISCLCIVLETMFELIIPMLMADMIDVGVVNKDKTYILIRGGLMIICAILALILGIFYAKYTAKAGYGFAEALRKDVFSQVQTFSFKNMDQFSSASVITRLTSDITILQTTLTTGLRPFVRSPIMLLTGLALSFVLNKQLAVVFFVAIPILAVGLFLIVSKVGPLYRGMQSAIDQVNTIVQENLTAIRVVKSFVRDEYEEIKFDQVNKNLQQASEKAFRTSVWNLPLFQFVMYANIISILWFGGNMIFQGSMQVGELTGFLSYVLQILNSLMLISNVFLMITRSIASCERIVELLEVTSEITDDNTSTHCIQQGDIIFQNVFFKYQETAGEYVLHNINLHIPAGSSVGILGGCGSAKTTLVQLIPRLYDVSDGSIYIDNVNIKDYALSHLRTNIAMVLQNNTLFSGTVKDNLLWGNKHASKKDLDWACEIAGVNEFIHKFEKGYDTKIERGGVNVSGGQKQRLCIARALLSHPKILILDDATSALDATTEAKVQQGLASLKQTTKLIIAQRIQSVQHTDFIIILDEGHIHAVGTHEQLLKTNAVYQEIYDSQQEGRGL